ncbi:MAG: hypothetical protein GY878_11015 [Fuerstiella sp.]|nr:hypothetical protein [Fuerstiella sp.]
MTWFGRPSVRNRFITSRIPVRGAYMDANGDPIDSSRTYKVNMPAPGKGWNALLQLHGPLEP